MKALHVLFTSHLMVMAAFRLHFCNENTFKLAGILSADLDLLSKCRGNQTMR